MCPPCPDLRVPFQSPDQKPHLRPHCPAGNFADLPRSTGRALHWQEIHTGRAPGRKASIPPSITRRNLSSNVLPPALFTNQTTKGVQRNGAVKTTARNSFTKNLNNPMTGANPRNSDYLFPGVAFLITGLITEGRWHASPPTLVTHRYRRGPSRTAVS